ncbi:hypothetical protein Dimus_002502 [Dionaea muscipula]
MAFEEFGQLSKRRRAERAEELRKKIIISIVSTILIFCLIAAAAYTYFRLYDDQSSSNKISNDQPANNNNNNNNNRTPKHDQAAVAKMLKTFCATADYKKKCEDTLSKAVTKANSSSVTRIHPKEIIQTAISAASDELAKATLVIDKFKFEKPDEKAAYEDCKKLFDDAKEELKDCIAHANRPMSKHDVPTRIHDLRTWLSAVISYQETCVDGFPDGGEVKKKMKGALNATRELVSNSLAVVAQLASFLSKYEMHEAASRHLLSSQLERRHHPKLLQLGDGIPQWMGHEERQLLVEIMGDLIPNVTVAKDGSGNFTTINAALAALPEKRQGRCDTYIYNISLHLLIAR